MTKTKSASGKEALTYKHPESSSPQRPDIGAQAHFRAKKTPREFRYDSSLSPALDWDGQNPQREEAEQKLAALQERLRNLIRQFGPAGKRPSEKALAAALAELEQAADEADALKALSQPFLHWAGKAERFSFEVPTLPLFVHERLSAEAILATVRGRAEPPAPSLFGERQVPLHERMLRAYEHDEDWTNRLILGDSLLVMNSLLGFEGMGGQVQTIYFDPPYGVKYGSNFQPFVRRRGAKHGDDEFMVREPEMVKAYRDTWDLGVHSYLTYLRDRLLIARDLLHPSGSIFVQISEKNQHHVREVMDEVFGEDGFVRQISFMSTSGFQTKTISRVGDYLLWYARDRERMKVRKLFEEQPVVPGEGNAKWILLPNGEYRGVRAAEKRGETPLPSDGRLYNPGDLRSQSVTAKSQPFEYDGKIYEPGPNLQWKAKYPEGMQRLAEQGRIHVARNSIRYRRFAADFPYQERTNLWTDTMTGSFTDDKIYAVQTNPKVVERCLLMTSDPGDLVLDPTCGSGTTAWCAEKWGRRWITIDTSRVPISLAKQRLLTAAFDYYELGDRKRGPAGGFVYRRRRNQKGEEVGGIVPHLKLKSIANDEPPEEEVLFDRPEVEKEVTRITGPFSLEATIPTPADWDTEGGEPVSGAEAAADHARHVARMVEVLRRAPVLNLHDGGTMTLCRVRPPARSMTLSAEAGVEGDDERRVAVVFGPEHGAVTEHQIFEAGREAHGKSYDELIVIGFAIEPAALGFVRNCEKAIGIPATYLQATMDLQMGDLLKSLRSSQIFSVCGLPDVRLSRDDDGRYRVELRGLDVFDPVEMTTDHQDGKSVPAWFLDHDYNDLCFHVCQAFFPRTSAWEALKRSLGADFDESAWSHLAGTLSAPFAAGEHRQVAVKAVDLRGNELLVVRSLADAESGTDP